MAREKRCVVATCQSLESRRLLSTSGAAFSYYEGTWSALPNFAKLRPVKTGVSPDFDTALRDRDSDYGLVWTAKVAVPTTGKYAFYAGSDDGSALLIDGKRVVSNDGLHAYAEKAGTVALTAGTHAITVEYFQAGRGHALTVSYKGPGVSKRAIPDAMLTAATPGNVYVHDYGAKGDGTTNDSAAVQSAIAAAADASTLVFDAGKTYKLNTGLTVNKPINIEGNGATLLLSTSAYPQNETLYVASPLAATSYKWKQTVTAGQTTFNVSVPTTALVAGDTVFVSLGTDPNDGTQPNWGEVCQVVSNTGTAVTIDTPVPYNISQGSMSNRIQRITDVIQNVAIKDLNFDYVDGTTPDANLWLNMVRNVAVSNIGGRFTIGANVVDSKNVTLDNLHGTLSQLTTSGGRMVTAYQTDGMSVTNSTATTAFDAPAVFLESWTRNTRISGVTVNSSYANASTQDVFHFTGNSYNTTADNVTVNNAGAVNLVGSGSQAADYHFGTVAVNGPLKSAPLTKVGRLTTGGQTYDATAVHTTTFAVPISANWNDFQVPLASGVVQTMAFSLSNLTGVNGLFVTNDAGQGSQLIGTLKAGQNLILPQFFGTDYQFNDPSHPKKTLHFYTGSAVPAGTLLTVSVTYYGAGGTGVSF